MALNTQAAFNEFLVKILPDDNHRKKMEDRRVNTHGHLQRAFPAGSSMPLLRTQLIGSAAKGTIRAPLKDIDVLAVFSNENNKYQSFNNAQEFLYEIRNALAGKKIQTIGSRGQAVRLFYTDNLHVDIAPVFYLNDGGYLLPGGSGQWITTNPDTQLSWFQGRINTLGFRLIPAVLMAKEWNEKHGGVLSSFHIETMTANLFTKMGIDYAQEMEVFFEYAIQHLFVNDPAGHSGDLSQHMTLQQKVDTITRLKAAKEKATRARTAALRGDHKASITLWREILGDKFPVYG